MMNSNRDEFDALHYDFSQKCSATTSRLYFLWNEHSHGHVNTDLDIQRSYQWTSAQEQEMWDSLLLNVRIPEFHAIMDSLTYNICDGKQRFTCLFRILNNAIPYYRNSARSACQWIFEAVATEDPKTGKKKIPTMIYFSDLPEELRANIFNITITIVQYCNLTREEQIMLFRKINNGTALSDFAKGLAEFFYMRTDYSQYILKHRHFLAPSFMDKNEEDIEKTLIRALLLCTQKNVGLQPTDMTKYYEMYQDFSTINAGRVLIQKTLDRIPNLSVMGRCRSWIAITPFVIWGVASHPELTDKQIAMLCIKASDFRSGRGRDLRRSCCEENKKYIEKIISEVKNE